MNLLVVDLFCGAGGVTTGFQKVPGVQVVACVNHDANAIASHEANHPKTLHYVDPPYIPSTRDMKVRYNHEYSLDDHEKLLLFLKKLKGKVVLSGYESELYSKHLKHWRVEKKQTRTTNHEIRSEVLWMNFKPDQFLF